ncbi:winged helix-turn-helix domain-containing protein [Natrialbaceae archaeon AArc-T1-2]|uniref:winged helix-turn-helix domain-containing protein n=1 Tax=Natrialbaceae archaeon AArc-T1-2 TaxID=3053904 RepID=UPI00255AAF50|nr:winged helix-turn-helix domain-containing protein [Natrialbaceae archaeon AArc-T1-2]WIV67525.1 winged helix-turn-helix domain-containing protein [Natrialbaceae archaeon AArc-T1-2]
MCTLDERILEHLEEESWSTPRYMEQAIELYASRARIQERCQMLTQVGLVTPAFGDYHMYEITSKGQEYLEGELDVEDLPRPTIHRLL